MSFSRIDHVWKLDQCPVSKLVRMVGALRGILGSSSDEDSAIVCLDGAEPDWYHEVDIQHFSLLPLLVDIVERYDFLVEFEEVDLVGPHAFSNLRSCLGSIYHSDAGLGKVVGHCQLGVPVEADVLTLAALVSPIDAAAVHAARPDCGPFCSCL